MRKSVALLIETSNRYGRELVHGICRPERLTFYNVLRRAEPQAEEETIKKRLVREYLFYLRPEKFTDAPSLLPLYAREKSRIRDVFDIK